MSKYTAFAAFYDRLTQNVDYKAIAVFIERQLDRYGIPGHLLLDLACGTGSVSEQMSRLGYEVIGVDGSSEMLAEAMNKKILSGLDMIYLCQDMQELDLYGTIDAAVCTLDSLNHLQDLEALQKVMNKVSLFLNPDGLFLFDMNTPYKHQEILADQTYVYDCENVFCVWQNSLRSSNQVQIHLDIFEKADRLYSRYEEEFYEMAYPIEQIKQVISQAGLELVECWDDYTDNRPDEKTQRIVYITKKIR